MMYLNSKTRFGIVMSIFPILILINWICNLIMGTVTIYDPIVFIIISITAFGIWVITTN